jgi:transposase
MQQAKTASRRRHDAELKRQVLDACAQPGASVAQVALAHSLNANLVHKWRRQAQGREGARTHTRREVFLPVALPAHSPPADADIRLEIKRAGTTVNIAWPLHAAASCAAWLRDVLR